MQDKQTQHQIPAYMKWQPLLIGLAAAFGVFIGLKIQLPKSVVKSESTNFQYQGSNQKILDAVNYLEGHYYDSLNGPQLADQTINALLSNLDPYSFYTPAYDVQKLEDDMDQHYMSSGIEWKYIDSAIYVCSVRPGSSAYKEGVKIGDQILSVNGTSLVKYKDPYSDSVLILMNNLDDHFETQVKRGHQVISMHLHKAEVQDSSVGLCFSPADKTLYLELSSVAQYSYREMMGQFEQAKIADASEWNLILDIRNNSGGLVPIAADIINQFIEEKDHLLFYTKGAHKEKQEYKSNGRSFFRFKKMILLINENTASAAELIAGCLWEKKLAQLVGQKTFGKGTIMEQFKLADGSLIRMATGRYYFPSGKCIEKSKQDSVSTATIAKGTSSGDGIYPDVPIAQGLSTEWDDEIENFVVLNYMVLNDQLSRSEVEFGNACKQLYTESKRKYPFALNNPELIRKIYYKTMSLSQGQSVAKKLSLDHDEVFQVALKELSK